MSVHEPQQDSEGGVRSQARYRLAIVSSHPIQYFVPLYQRLASMADMDVTVFFCSLQGAETYVDAEFGEALRWDIPLLEGYPWKLLPEVLHRSQVGGFLSLVNPTVIREIRRGKFDAVLVHGHGYVTLVLAALAARVLGVPVLTRAETHLGLSRSAIKRVLRRPIMGVYYRGICTVCLAIGSRNAEFYRSLGVPTERIALAPYSVDNHFFHVRSESARVSRGRYREELGIPPDAAVLLYASKLVPRKRPMDVLLAHERLVRAGENVALVFAGSGSEEDRLREYAREAGVPGVHFVGFKNQSQLPGLYALSDIFVLSSEQEPWGLVINEAMACGLPIVCTDEIGAAPDLVRNGVNGYTYPAGSVDHLTEHLSVLAGDATLRRSMGTESREIVSTWGVDDTVAGIVSELERLHVRDTAMSKTEETAAAP